MQSEIAALFECPRGPRGPDYSVERHLGQEDFATAAVPIPSRDGLVDGILLWEACSISWTDRSANPTRPRMVWPRGESDALCFDRDGTLWVSTESGLSRLKNGRFVTLTKQNGLPCDGVTG